MKRNNVKLGFFVIFTIFMCVFLFSACGLFEKEEEPVRLEKPIIILSGNVVSWDANDKADKFEISINGNLSYIESSSTTRVLEDSQSFKIRAIGNGYSYLTSEWSNSVTYEEPEIELEPEETYTIIWKNGDEILEVDDNVNEGTMPSYDGDIPTKDSTLQNSYTFSGWTPQVSVVTESVTYTAQFEERARNYIVTFYAEDGVTVLERVSVEYGGKASFTKTTPTKEATEGYSYTFRGWTTAKDGNMIDDLSNVIQNRSVYAAFTTEANKVDVFIAINNTAYGSISHTVLNDIPYNAIIQVHNNAITINGKTVTAIPSNTTPQYSYSFISWTTPTNVGVGTIITANFACTTNSYTVTWKNGGEILEIDENVLYGSMPDYNGMLPTKENEGDKSYYFKGWTPTVTSVTSDAVYHASFYNSENSPLVSFYDYDGRLIEEQVVEYGKSAIAPQVPYREGYRFIGWDKDYNNVVENLVITAQYVKTYNVKFVDIDNFIIDVQIVDENGSAEAPEFSSNSNYEFIGWSGNFDNVTSDLVIKAECIRLFTVEFLDYNGTSLKTEIVRKGNNATPPTAQRIGYTLVGWSESYENINQNKKITAIYEINSYQVEFKLIDGQSLIQNVLHGKSAIDPKEESPELISDSYADLKLGKVYMFTRWDTDFSCVTDDLVVKPLYEEEIAGLSLVVDSKIVEQGQTKVVVCVYACGEANIYGFDIKLSYDSRLNENESANIKLSVKTTENSQLQVDGVTGYVNAIYADPINISGTKELIRFEFELEEYAKLGEYGVDLLEESYLVSSNMQKVEPFLKSGSVTIVNKGEDYEK